MYNLKTCLTWPAEVHRAHQNHWLAINSIYIDLHYKGKCRVNLVNLGCGQEFRLVSELWGSTHAHDQDIYGPLSSRGDAGSSVDCVVFWSHIYPISPGSFPINLSCPISNKQMEKPQNQTKKDLRLVLLPKHWDHHCIAQNNIVYCLYTTVVNLCQMCHIK